MQASVAGSYNSVGEYLDGNGSRRASHSGEHFILTPEAVGTGPGMDSRTTLMIRNIPNKYTQKILMQTIDGQGFYGKYDFFYLPIDFKNRCNVGYAFINMASTDVRPPLRMLGPLWVVLAWAWHGADGWSCTWCFGVFPFHFLSGCKGRECLGWDHC